VRQILSKSEKEVCHWRDAIREAVGKNGQLMVNLIPELENANPLKAGALVRLTCFCLPERVRNGWCVATGSRFWTTTFDDREA
jgi:predicted ATPase